MNIITKILFSLMFLVFGMFSSTVNAAAGEAVFDSFDDCDQARVAYTPVGRNKMTTGQVMTIGDIHPNFSDGVCVHSSQVVRRVNGRAVVTSGWVYLLGDFPVVKVGRRYYMQACSNPIEQIGAPRRVAAEPPTDIYADEDRVQVPPSYTPPPRQQVQVVERVIYMDNSQPVQPQRRERFCDRHSRGCDIAGNVVATTLGTFLGNGLCNNNGWCRGNQGGSRRRYVDDNRLPPRRRPGEPIDHGGTQWREPRQWDNNGFSRDNAREPISYNNNGQWSF